MEQIKKYLPHTILILALIGLVSFLGTSYSNIKESHEVKVKQLTEQLQTSTKTNWELERKIYELKVEIEKLNISRTTETEVVRKADGSSSKKTKTVYTKSQEKTNTEQKQSDTSTKVNTEDNTQKTTEVTEVDTKKSKEVTKKSSSITWGLVGTIAGFLLCPVSIAFGVPICL